LTLGNPTPTPRLCHHRLFVHPHLLMYLSPNVRPFTFPFRFRLAFFSKCYSLQVLIRRYITAPSAYIQLDRAGQRCNNQQEWNRVRAMLMKLEDWWALWAGRMHAFDRGTVGEFEAPFLLPLPAVPIPSLLSFTLVEPPTKADFYRTIGIHPYRHL
jgi:hypothetical protein